MWVRAHYVDTEKWSMLMCVSVWWMVESCMLGGCGGLWDENDEERGKRKEEEEVKDGYLEGGGEVLWGGRGCRVSRWWR